jgi:outer membrane protein assembly factor BamB
VRSLLLAAIVAASAVAALAADWPQFGGPGRDFTAPAALPASWPASGPRQLWARELGDGYSGIAAVGGVLYTQYHPAKGMLASLMDRFRGAVTHPEVVIAVDAATGRTLWEHAYDAGPPGVNLEYGPGPNATPLVHGGLVYAAGVTGKLHALDAKTGGVVWSQDLWGALGGKRFDRGYSNSPVAYGSTIIVFLGGAGQGVVALDAKSGSVVWKGGNFDAGGSSPLLINVNGQEQLVVFHPGGVAGMDPRNGTVLWDHPHRTDYGLNISLPIWGPDNILFVSSAYSAGSRALQLSQSGGRTTVKELWFSNKMRLHFGNGVRIGDYVYGSSGDFGPAFFTAVNVRTGEAAWQERGLARAQFVNAGSTFVLLDEDGALALATATPQKFSILGRAEVLTHRAWTAPTVAGTRVFVRDRAMMKAFDLAG